MRYHGAVHSHVLRLSFRPGSGLGQSSWVVGLFLWRVLRAGALVVAGG